MEFIKFWLLLSILVEISLAMHIDSNPAIGKAGVEPEKPRFLDLDGFISSALNGMSINVDQSHHVNQGATFVNSVTQTHRTIGGQSIVKTEITRTTGNYAGFRSGKGLLHDLADSMEKKTDVVKDKLSGAIADGINIAHSGYAKIKDSLKYPTK